ncbi:MAG: DUF1501 domain-containing protein [Planctomycetes bacterium]|nr:DUF1501 domain-containing protein [Planctomycetota bacterium]
MVRKAQATGTQRGCIDCDGQSGFGRRSFLKLGAFSFMGMGLLDLLRADVLAGSAGGRCDSVILVWLGGGPSHIDTWDPKPGHANGGPFKPLATSADGIQISEHFPILGRNMKHGSLVRSLTSKEGSHERATYEMHTGYKPLASIKHPSLGSLAAHEMDKKNADLPSYISIGGSSWGAGFLGAKAAPFMIGDPNNPMRNVKIPDGVNQGRYNNRMQLLRSLDTPFAKEERHEVVLDYGGHFNDAVQLMYSQSVKAFDLKNENPAVVARYGNDGFAKSCLIARRLVEAGVRFVEVSLGGWDTHNDAFKTALPNLSRRLDTGLGNLVEDLAASGKLDSTMILCTGEFGRTPQINNRDGRDHYPRVWSAFVAGGGIKKGHVHGSSDEAGAAVKDAPVRPGDLHATMFELMGVDYRKENFSKDGRPIKVVNEGEPIKALIG